jgi:hypothetical protein
LGLATFRKGHYWLFWIGFFLPILRIVGAPIAPTERAAVPAAGVAQRPAGGSASQRLEDL